MPGGHYLSHTFFSIGRSCSLSLSLCTQMTTHPFLVALITALVLQRCWVGSDALAPDGISLLAFKSAISSDPTSALADWNDNSPDPCQWSGVTCANVTGFSAPRVVAVTVSGKNLSGYIPSELGALIYLRRLNLHGNLLSGPIPTHLSNASSLHSLFLYSNALSGPFPSSLCDIPRLQNLDLSGNALSGPLPEDLRSCRQLQRLQLSGNKFSGPIPAGVWPELENLVQIDLSSNSFNGSIPPDMGKLSLLTGVLNLSNNQLSGEIPADLGKIPASVSLDLRNNDLSGEIPQTGNLASQRTTYFLGNPNLCGYPLSSACKSSPGSAVLSHDRGEGSGGSFSSTSYVDGGGKKELSKGMIVLISVADAFGVALIGIILVVAYWRVKDYGTGCSCTRRSKLGGGDSEKVDPSLCCFSCCSGRGLLGCSNFQRENAGEGTPRTSSEEEEEEGKEGELVAIDKEFRFELDELLRASAYVLGKSGQGIVYKVVLGNGVPVAVRRLGEGGCGGERRRKEFAAEVAAVGRVKHPNIVRLRAYYWAQDEKLLITDFIPNGSLATALRGQPPLSWELRLKIAKRAARGLAHIHECSPRKFVHGDIKPSNILLDADLDPCVSDFGVTRLVGIAGDESEAPPGVIFGGAIPTTTTSSRSGPLEKPNNSYRAPEARLLGSRPTQRWDVYSFGVVLLEMLTGRSSSSPEPHHSPSPTATSPDADELVRWVRKVVDEESPLSEIVDPVLLKEGRTQKEVVAVLRVAISCTETDPDSRPRMKTVSDNLDKIGAHTVQ